MICRSSILFLKYCCFSLQRRFTCSHTCVFRVSILRSGLGGTKPIVIVRTSNGKKTIKSCTEKRSRLFFRLLKKIFKTFILYSEKKLAMSNLSLFALKRGTELSDQCVLLIGCALFYCTFVM